MALLVGTLLILRGYAALRLVISVWGGVAGFVLGTTAMVAFGVRWSWVIVLAGVAGAVLLALAAIVGDLPLVILALLGAFAGSATILAGVMLLAGVLDSPDLAAPGTTRMLDPSGWWTAAYVALALVGFVTQLRSADTRRGTLRQSWAA